MKNLKAFTKSEVDVLIEAISWIMEQVLGSPDVPKELKDGVKPEGEALIKRLEESVAEKTSLVIDKYDIELMLIAAEKYAIEVLNPLYFDENDEDKQKIQEKMVAATCIVFKMLNTTHVQKPEESCV